MSDSDSDRDPVEVLAEEFSQRRRKGEQPTIEDYAKAHPHLAERIRRLFPMLIVMDEVGETELPVPSVRSSQTATFMSSGSQTTAPAKSDKSWGELLRESQNEDYRTTVYRRTVTFYGLSTFIYVVFTAIIYSGGNPFLKPESIGWPGLIIFTVITGYTIFFLYYCIRYPQLPLVRLRRLEWFALFLAMVFLAYLQWCVVTPRKEFEGPNHAMAYVTLCNFGHCFGWFVGVVTYGLLVPNPWWRMAVASAIAFVIAASVAPFAAILNVSIRDHLLYLTSWSVSSSAIASALAIFSSFKISSLQSEVYEAKKLGPYQLKKQLGRGGMGEVYLAEHRLLKRPCAVKIIRPERADEGDLLSRFEREVQVTAQLTHPNTVEIFDYGRSEDGTFYYVMEYLDGINLDDLVSEHGPMPAARAVHFAKQLCGALREAHGNGLVHRDIKPSNVIVCQQGGIYDVVKLLDFGLVGTMQTNPEATKLTGDGMALGTPQFMSPEQVRGSGTVDARSDIYSLGGLMYFLLTGRTPFEADSGYAMALAHIEQPVPSMRSICPDIPEDVEAIVELCLAKKPEDRFDGVQTLESALKQCDCREYWTTTDATEWWTNQSQSGS